MRFTEDAALAILEECRWEGVPKCAFCDGINVRRIPKRKTWRCQSCRAHFSVTSGTVFASSKLSYSVLCEATLLYDESSGKVAASHMARRIGVTFKTAMVLKRKIGEGYLSSRGLLAEPAYLSRWYWQGFNLWEYDHADGRCYRYNKHGMRREAFSKKEEVDGRTG